MSTTGHPTRAQEALPDPRGRDEVERGTTDRASEVPDARLHPPLWRPGLMMPGLVMVALACLMGVLLVHADPRSTGDYQFLNWLDDQRLGPVTSATLVLDFIGGPKVTPYLTLAIMVVMMLRKRVILGLLVGAITFLSWLPGHFAKAIWDRQRPGPDLHPIFEYKGPGASSFPSGHTSFVVALVVALAFALGVTGHLRRWALVIGGLLVVLAGFARLYLAVHWPTDVVAGILFGLGTALVLWPIATWLYSRARQKWPTWA